MSDHPDAGLLAAEREMAEISKAGNDHEMATGSIRLVPERWRDLRHYIADTAAFSIVGCGVKARIMADMLEEEFSGGDLDAKATMSRSLSDDLARLAATTVATMGQSGDQA